MQIKLLADGGAMKPGPALSQKLGPAGIPMNTVLQKINDATKDFSGMKVPVEIDINVNTKEIKVKIFSPPVSGLLKKEAGIETASGLQKKYYAGNLSIEQVISVAKTKMPNLLCKDLMASVKSVVGSCVSLGLLIENKPSKEIMRDIEDGKYDKEIKACKTETSPEKKKEIQDYFAKLKADQDKLMKQEKEAQAAKEAEAAKTAPATATTATATTTATPAPVAKK